ASRRRHTRLVSDWSSDVCCSDLGRAGSDPAPGGAGRAERGPGTAAADGTQRIGAAGPGVVSLPVLAGEPPAGVRTRGGAGTAAGERERGVGGEGAERAWRGERRA